MPDFEIDFTNYSATAFTNLQTETNVLPTFTTVNQTPGPTLQANGGTQTYSLSVLADGMTGFSSFDIWCYWEGNGIQFGIQIHVPTQIADVGTAPYWYAYSSLAPDNHLLKQEPSVTYTWPAAIGFNIVATPTAGHSTLSVSVVIQDLAAQP